jgi:hypothetical protein
MKGLKAKNPITCQRCGVVDQTRKDAEGNWTIGTNNTMRCEDCAGLDGKATLCRHCCPTEHGTTWKEETA